MNYGTQKMKVTTMKRKAVLFLVISLLAIGVLIAPSPAKDQNVVAVMPTANCQDVPKTNCQEVRNRCYADMLAVFEFCKVLTGDLDRCNKEFNESYRACAGECW